MADETSVPGTDEVVPPVIEGEGGAGTPKTDAPVTPPEGEGATVDEEDIDSELEEDKIPIRGSAAHIIARQKQTIEKLRSKEVDPEDNPFNLPQDDQEAINHQVDKKIAPLVDAIVGRVDEDELKSLYEQEPDAKKFDKRIRSFMKHPSWKDVPVSAIFHHLAFESAAKIGAKKRELADKEAAGMKGAGSSKRTPASTINRMPTEEEIQNMSDAEFEKLQSDVNRGKYQP